MRLVDAQTAPDYLRDHGLVGDDEPVEVHELAGGVSNLVLLITRPSRPEDAFVLKQSRPQLRVEEPWHCSPERIWREIDMLRAIARVAPRAAVDEWLSLDVPRVLFEDRGNFLFTMTAAAEGHATWKSRLLSGLVEPEIATTCGQWLGRLHGRTWGDAELAARFADRTFFELLRLDPYYRQLGRLYPDWTGRMASLCERLEQHPRALVLADFSPKNLLVCPGGLLVVDFETGHFGDPAFDMGFFLAHLGLKAIWAGNDAERYLGLTSNFLRAYQAVFESYVAAADREDFEARAVENFAACAWARLDGKSRVEYLPDARAREAVRQECRQLLNAGVTTFSDMQDAWRELTIRLPSEHL